jgi:TolB-like protein/TM2 domain-containing membrane protein YozV
MGTTMRLDALFAATLLLPTTAHAFCDDLTAGAAKAPGYVIAPVECDAEQKLCADVEQRLAKCLGRGGAKVVLPQALQAAVGEGTLREAGGKNNLLEIGLSFGTKRVAVASVKAKTALVRILNAESGEVVSAVRIPLDEDGGKQTLPPATLNESLRRLGDRLAASFRALPGASKKRVAVLPFKENGEQSVKNALGTLVAAELITRFRRDYDFTVVERSRLDAVLKEMELAQLGLIDEKNAPKLGQLVEADAIVIGTALDAGPAVKVYAQVIDVVSGVTLAADNSELPSAGLIALSSDAVVLRSKGGAFFRSLLIPGWGQLYNQQPVKGYAFIALTLALGGTAGLMQGLSAMAAADYRRASSNFDAIAQRAENFQIAATTVLCTLGAFWIYNVIDAYASGKTFDSAVAGGSAAASD